MVLRAEGGRMSGRLVLRALLLLGIAAAEQLMAKPVVFDGRNIWNPQRLADLGFTYHGVGRRS